MNLMSWLFGIPSEGVACTSEATPAAMVNPANGLPMLDDCIDVAGNPYGMDASDIGPVHDDMASDWGWTGATDTSGSSWD